MIVDTWEVEALIPSKWAIPLEQTTSAALRYEPAMATIRRHPAALAVELAITAPAAALILVLLLSFWHEVVPVVPVAVPAVVVVALWLYVAWLRWASASMTLTDRRVVLMKGVLSQVERTIPFKRIQYLGLRQSIVGRLLGFGTVEIGVAGYPDPHTFSHAPVRQVRERFLIPIV
jgi:uncharacterized membrane protein YdbT with pleckstrin-like domain